MDESTDPTSLNNAVYKYLKEHEKLGKTAETLKDDLVYLDEHEDSVVNIEELSSQSKSPKGQHKKKLRGSTEAVSNNKFKSDSITYDEEGREANSSCGSKLIIGWSYEKPTYKIKYASPPQSTPVQMKKGESCENSDVEATPTNLPVKAKPIHGLESMDEEAKSSLEYRPIIGWSYEKVTKKIEHAIPPKSTPVQTKKGESSEDSDIESIYNIPNCVTVKDEFIKGHKSMDEKAKISSGSRPINVDSADERPMLRMKYIGSPTLTSVQKQKSESSESDNWFEEEPPAKKYKANDNKSYVRETEVGNAGKFADERVHGESSTSFLYGTQVTATGPGLHTAFVNKEATFTVDTTHGGYNLLFVGVLGPEIQCEEVRIKHIGQRMFEVNYIVQEPGNYTLFIKWGDQNISGSPYQIVVH